MAYTKITRTAHGREALSYALKGKGHDGSEQRNLYVSGVNMMPPDVASYAEQMERYWIRAGSRNKTQINRVIASFSHDELDPDDPESPLIAAQICEEFLQGYYPGRQAVVCIQNDGEGHKLHGHMLVSNTSMCEVQLPGDRVQKPYAGCRGYQLKFDYVKENFNKTAENYIILDQGEKAKDKATQNERRMRQHNEKLVDGEQAKYIWKDDLKERVKRAMSEASDKDDFLEKLTGNGVEGTFHETKKGRKYYTYELTDISGFNDGKVPQNLRARSYKMGADFDYEAINRLFPDKPEPASGAPAIQRDSAPRTEPQDAPAVKIAMEFGKRKAAPLSATQGIQKAASVPVSGNLRFGKQRPEPLNTAQDMPGAPPVKAQASPPPDPWQEAERQRKEKERMEAENRKRQAALRRQAGRVIPTYSELCESRGNEILENDARKSREEQWDLSL